MKIYKLPFGLGLIAFGVGVGMMSSFSFPGNLGLIVTIVLGVYSMVTAIENETVEQIKTTEKAQ